jgi:hypothetical protein
MAERHRRTATAAGRPDGGHGYRPHFRQEDQLVSTYARASYHGSMAFGLSTAAREARFGQNVGVLPNGTPRQPLGGALVVQCDGELSRVGVPSSSHDSAEVPSELTVARARDGVDATAPLAACSDLRRAARDPIEISVLFPHDPLDGRRQTWRYCSESESRPRGWSADHT